MKNKVKKVKNKYLKFLILVKILTKIHLNSRIENR